MILQNFLAFSFGNVLDFISINGTNKNGLVLIQDLNLQTIMANKINVFTNFLRANNIDFGFNFENIYIFNNSFVKSKIFIL